MRSRANFLLAFLLLPSLVFAQSELRSASKGATTAGPVTSTSVDANTQALDVFIKGGAGSGGTAATDNSAFTGGTTNVTPMGALYDTTPPAVSDGSIGAPRMNSARQLQVDCVAGCGGSGGTAMTDDAAFTAGTTTFTPVGCLADITTPDSVDENDGGACRMSLNRNIFIQIRDGAGNERGLNVDANGEIGIGAIRNALPAGTNNIGDVDVLSVVPGTGATNLGKAEDAGHTTGDTGVPAWCIRYDDATSSVFPTALAGTTLDYSGIACDSAGRLVTRLAVIGASTVDVNNGTAGNGTQRVTIASDSTGTIGVSSLPGTGVEDAAETAGGTLHMMGTVRRDTAASSAGTTGDNATLNTDSLGRAWTRPTGSVTPADNFAIPSDAITVWSINGCYDGTNIDLCAKATAGAGNTDSNTQRVVIAKDSAVCNPKDTAQVAISTASSGNVELVALTSGQTIYVCDFTLIAGGTVGVQLIYGTGTACATGETNMSGVLPLVANAGWTHNYDGRLKTAEANAFCIELSAAVQVDGVLTYRKAATF